MLGNNNNTNNNNEIVYTPLQQNGDDIENGIDNNNDNDIDKQNQINVNNSNDNNNNDDSITIKLLNKEKTVDICNLLKNNTIKELKDKIYSVTEVEPQLQRLIYGGKPLKPDNKKLSDFKIENGSNIHLFPIPSAIANAISSGTNNTVPVIGTSVLPFNISSTIDNSNISNLIYDPYVQQTCRQIKLWSIVLLVLSYMELFNNTSYILSTGKFGNGFIDNTVTLLDTLCSIGGIYVGQLGLLTTRTLDLQLAYKYVRYLTILAFMCIIMRLLWILDVVAQITEVVKLNKNNNEDNLGNDDYSGNDSEMGEKVIQRFTIQATICAIVIISAWVSCVFRGVRLRTLLQTYHESMSPNAV